MKSDPPAKRKARIGLVLLIPLLCLGFIFIWRGAAAWQEGWQGRGREPMVVRFVHVDTRAAEACVAGNVNAWPEKMECICRWGDTWQAAVPVDPGRHQHLFVVDGRLRTDDPKHPPAEDENF